MEQLKRWREARGLSQTKLAARADVNPATVNQIEGGKRTASPATLHKLAGALDVSLYELLEGEPSPKAPRRSSLEPSLFNGIEGERLAPEGWQQALTRVLEPVRSDVRLDQQAFNRLHASEGVPQTEIRDIPEAEAARRFVDEFSPEERPLAFGEVALGYARLEHNLAQVQELLRERDQKIAQLEEENAKLRENHERVEAEKA